MLLWILAQYADVVMYMWMQSLMYGVRSMTEKGRRFLGYSLSGTAKNKM